MNIEKKFSRTVTVDSFLTGNIHSLLNVNGRLFSLQVKCASSILAGGTNKQRNTIVDKLTWEQTEQQLDEIFKWFYTFYEQYPPDEIKRSQLLQSILHTVRRRAIDIHNRRIAINMEQLKKQRESSSMVEHC